MPYSMQAFNAASLILLCTRHVASHGFKSPQIAFSPLLQA